MRPSAIRNSKLTRTDILLLEFTGQVALQDVARSADDLFFFGARQAHFTKVVFPVPPSPTMYSVDMRSQQKRCDLTRQMVAIG
jgi:hypothetical protein